MGRVERNRDYIYLESHGPDALPIDLTNASRYRVEVRFRQPIEEYNELAELYRNHPEYNPFRRDGDFTILTDYFYFNDVNGTPELAFVSC